MWALAVTQPRAELRASQALARFGYPNHVFKHEITGAFRGRFIKRFVPAFPNYIFIFILDEMREFLHQLWPYIGLRDFVSVSETSNVAQTALDQLLAQADPNDVLPVDNEQAARFKFGDRVQIITGAHAAFGCEGIYQYTVRPGRVCILSPWLGQLVPIELSESDVELLSKIQASHKKRRKKRGRRGGRNRMRWRSGRSSMRVRGSMGVQIERVAAN